LIENDDFRLDKDGDSFADGWSSGAGSTGYQEFDLAGNNLYILTVSSNNDQDYARIEINNHNFSN
jgi:hypothetical protein